jgi:hypothetical protein
MSVVIIKMHENVTNKDKDKLGKFKTSENGSNKPIIYWRINQTQNLFSFLSYGALNQILEFIQIHVLIIFIDSRWNPLVILCNYNSKRALVMLCLCVLNFAPIGKIFCPFINVNGTACPVSSLVILVPSFLLRLLSKASSCLSRRYRSYAAFYLYISSHFSVWLIL